MAAGPERASGARTKAQANIQHGVDSAAAVGIAAAAVETAAAEEIVVAGAREEGVVAVVAVVAAAVTVAAEVEIAPAALPIELRDSRQPPKVPPEGISWEPRGRHSSRRGLSETP